jgi:hypothetical protein
MDYIGDGEGHIKKCKKQNKTLILSEEGKKKLKCITALEASGQFCT